jgi:uncharacterized protein (TIGR02996 family)
MTDLYCRPEALAFLSAAKDRPEDNHPRLALADWLEERGDAERAEFIRLQCRLAHGEGSDFSPDEHHKAKERTKELIACRGGAWLGSLWEHGGTWHRGLLSLNFERHAWPEILADIQPWIDTVRFEVTGRD